MNYTEEENREINEVEAFCDFLSWHVPIAFPILMNIALLLITILFYASVNYTPTPTVSIMPIFGVISSASLMSSIPAIIVLLIQEKKEYKNTGIWGIISTLLTVSFLLAGLIIKARFSEPLGCLIIDLFPLFYGVVLVLWIIKLNRIVSPFAPLFD